MEILEESKRILLREIIPEDWEEMHEYSSNEETCKFQPWGPNTEEDSHFFINQAIRDRKKRYRRRFVFVIYEKVLKRIIGNIEMNIRDWDGVGEIGFIIHQGYWGKGYGSEAALLILRHSFESCKMHRVFATCDPANVASARVLENIGMVKEGILRKDLLIKGNWRDSAIYGILEEEWGERKNILEEKWL
ncbi:GNAT family protein [Halobacillus rhizosphaerae]|uniref:GNAT family N-acetyltransferase n=1 Tax=Halobacillus rhizosphaerae TaxID=3064889 RepID=UPI00398A70BD